MSSSTREFVRWALCCAVVLTAHVSVAAGFAAWQEEPDDNGEPSGAVVVELAPFAVMRTDVPLDIAPGPDQVQSEAAQQAPEEKQAEKTEDQPMPPAEEKPVLPLTNVQDAEVALPQAEKPPEPVKQTPQPLLPAPTTSAVQAVSDRQGPVAQAPVQAAPKGPPSDAMPKWQHRLETILERNKRRYPGGARNRLQQGVVLVSFVVDRQGKLQSSRIVRSSGHTALDEEAISLLSRSDPFPPPPAGLPGANVGVTVEVRFNLENARAVHSSRGGEGRHSGRARK